MIRAGRDVVDRTEIARLHGMTPATADRRKPWSAEGHPAPVYAHRQLLWDGKQAEAYANGDPIPVLPEVDSPEDLLDRYEAAAVAGLHENSWQTGRSRGTFPAADADKYGVPFWRRSTVAQFMRFRAERGSNNPAGRPQGIAQRPRADAAALEQQIREILAAHEKAGTTPVHADIASKLNVHVNTIRKHISTINKGVDHRRVGAAALEQQIREILAAHKKAGTTPVYADIASELGVHVNTVQRRISRIRKGDAAADAPGRG